MLLENRTAFVTGASRGIGAAIARKLASHGATVGVNYLQNREAAEAVVAQIEAGGGRAVAVQGDTRNPEQTDALVREVTSALGPIDTLVVNAAMSFPTVSFMDFAWEDFEAKLVGEISSAFNACRAVVPGMIDQGKGSIIGISSALSRQPSPGYIAHATAKSGLDAFMKSLALELGPNCIRVNVVAPGLTETDATAHIPAEIKAGMAQHIPLCRCGQPDDIAGVVALLASDEACYVTGSYIFASGGMQML
jgi:3-oxoacyl-[acyl-carrier protein] reductase